MVRFYVNHATWHFLLTPSIPIQLYFLTWGASQSMVAREELEEDLEIACIAKSAQLHMEIGSEWATDE
jgi:hypothetical protein